MSGGPAGSWRAGTPPPGPPLFAAVPRTAGPPVYLALAEIAADILVDQGVERRVLAECLGGREAGGHGGGLSQAAQNGAPGEMAMVTSRHGVPDGSSRKLSPRTESPRIRVLKWL